MSERYRSFLMFAFAMTLSACARSEPPVVSAEERVAIAERMALVREIKAYQEKLGWNPTTNFTQYEGGLVTYDYCLVADPLSFEIRSYEIGKNECAQLGKGGKDTVFYQYEALASIGTPLSRSMVAADLARFIMVVFHEDFHEQIASIPSLALNESATQLIGFLAARDFALAKYGEHSQVYRALAHDVEESLRDADIERRYHDALSRLYEERDRGAIDRATALARKAKLYQAMRVECASVRLATADSCVNNTNNAALGQSYLYARYYPLFYDLHTCFGRDAKKTSAAIVALVGEMIDEEHEFVRRVHVLIAGGCR